MTTQTQNFQAMQERIEKLEKQCLRLRQAGRAILLFGVSGLGVLLMAQVPPNRRDSQDQSSREHSRVVEAEQFILKDKSGKMRAQLWMLNPETPELVLYGPDGKAEKAHSSQTKITNVGFTTTDASGLPSMAMSDGFLMIRSAEGDVWLSAKRQPSLSLSDNDGSATLYGGKNPSLSLCGPGKMETAGLLGGPTPFLSLKGRKESDVMLIGGLKPGLHLTDGEGFAATFGSTATTTIRTGEVHETSAASVLLFGKEGRVLWKAP